MADRFLRFSGFILLISVLTMQRLKIKALEAERDYWHKQSLDRNKHG